MQFVVKVCFTYTRRSLENLVSHALTTAQKMEARKISVWCRQDVRFFSDFVSPVIGLSVILGHRQAARLDSARLGSALLPKVLPKVGVWCRRDNMFSNKLAFGVDETTLDF